MKFKRKTMIVIGILVGLFIVINMAACAFTSQKKFGRLPKNKRLERVRSSSNYEEKEFKNLIPTASITADVKPIELPIELLFKKSNRARPKDSIPSVKTNLKTLDLTQDILIWFGHSSYFIQINGKRILIDPVLCGNAAPVSFMIKAFKGADIYKAEDMPFIDYLFITHDHWDHLDYETVTQLKNQIGRVICSLGVGEHFERWGFDMNKVVELDWEEEEKLDNDFSIYCLPTRHFSGRSQKRNQSLWASYLLQTPNMSIYIGGDGGYANHIASIGNRFGEIDLALLENGQYNDKWMYIHTLPEQTIQAAKDLRAKAFIPGHSSKFSLSSHAWDEPLIRITEANKVAQLRMLTPMIGEPVYLKDTTQKFNNWWEGVR